jgi:UDP-N-acetyl-D-mannosaminuronate dehydrogenase
MKELSKYSLGAKIQIVKQQNKKHQELNSSIRIKLGTQLRVLFCNFRHCKIKILAADNHLSQSNVLVFGFAFMEVSSDIHNIKVACIIRKMQSYGVGIGSTDQYADTQKAMHEYQFEMDPKALTMP